MEQEQVVKIKCPHCGWIRSLHVHAVEDEVMATVARGVSDDLRAAVGRIRERLARPELEAANAWVDMPKCPHCGKVYRYNVRTDEVAP